ncbi:MAG: magnesium transporter CorA family protein [Candidatus Riflebacteria bacterium]|nr:magnesium transporter CorA family protein [Candidatus Riflebacteria bacterium]
MAIENYFHLLPGKQFKKLETREDVIKALSLKGFVWIDLESPDLQSLTHWQEPLQLFQMSIDDCMDDNHLQKINEFPNYTFISFNEHLFEKKILIQREINFFIGKNFLLTVHFSEPENYFFKRLDTEIMFKKSYTTDSPDFLLHSIMDYIVDSKLEVIEKIEDEVGRMEDEILASGNKAKSSELLELRRQIIFLRKDILREREIMIKICHNNQTHISKKSLFHFRELYDHVFRLCESIEVCREMNTSLMELYLSQISIKISNSANQTNMVMRRLTVLMTIFSPLAVLTGFFGMSEWTMITGSENWQASFPIFFIAMCTIGAANYLLLRKWHWT